jgi:hypothetical protein
MRVNTRSILIYTETIVEDNEMITVLEVTPCYNGVTYHLALGEHPDGIERAVAAARVDQEMFYRRMLPPDAIHLPDALFDVMLASPGSRVLANNAVTRVKVYVEPPTDRRIGNAVMDLFGGALAEPQGTLVLPHVYRVEATSELEPLVDLIFLHLWNRADEAVTLRELVRALGDGAIPAIEAIHIKAGIVEYGNVYVCRSDGPSGRALMARREWTMQHLWTEHIHVKGDPYFTDGVPIVTFGRSLFRL